MTKGKALRTRQTPPRTKTIELDFPVEFEGETVTELTIRRMKAGDSLVSEGTEDKGRAGMELMAALTDRPVELIAELDLEDFVNLSEAMAGMLGKHGKAAQRAMGAAANGSPGAT